MNNKHFEFTDEDFHIGCRVLYRIRAIRDIPEHGVEKGDLGGFVESYDNLSDDAWVFDDAKVYGDARVSGYARVLNNAAVYGFARVFGNAVVCDDAQVFDHAKVYESARVCGNALVEGAAVVYGYAYVFDDAQVFGYAELFGAAKVGDRAQIFEYAQVLGDVTVCGNAQICGTALVRSIKDYAVFKNFWSSGRHCTWTRSNNMWKAGCFYGTGEELIRRAYKDSDMSGKLYECIVKAVNEMNELLNEVE